MTSERYGEAYQQGFDKTMRFLISRGASRDQAREGAQAAWARGWERVKQLRNEEIVGTWVNAIALNVSRGSFRNEQARQIQLSTRSGSTTVTDLAAIDMARILQACRPGDRELLEQQLHGLTAAEIAQKHGITATAMRIRFMRARQSVRVRMERRARRTRLAQVSRLVPSIAGRRYLSASN